MTFWCLCLCTLLVAAIPTVISDFTNFTNKIVFKFEDDLLPRTSAGAACSDNNVGRGPMVNLLNFIATQYLNSCVSVILYDEFFYKGLTSQPVIMQLLKTFPGPMIHGQFSTADLTHPLNTSILLSPHDASCRDYIVLSQTLEPMGELLGHQPHSKVVLVPQVSQWQINNFLESPSSDQFINLLVIADPSFQLDFFNENERPKIDINLYTHELYADVMGTRVPRLLTAWRCDRLTRLHVSLFPPKMMSINGYQLRVVATAQPPYVYQRFQLDRAGDAEAQWDGLEVRLLKLVSDQLNFTIKFQLPSKSSWENTAQSVLADLRVGNGDVAVAGVYATVARLKHFQISIVHSHDCAVFMTLASTALSKYRAIMGPFRWEVWMTVTLAYLFAILPITFSAHHTLRTLLDDPCEIENMFWYVFGTFTNCFTFTGKQSWIGSKMSSTRMFIGTYWAFSIIVSAAYTGSIIAFIMSPKFPDVIETTQQLDENNIRLLATNNSDLKESVYNSTEASILRLSHKMKIVNSVEEAVSNVTDSPFFTDYAFLHSREFLKHIITTNFSTKKFHKKSMFHLSQNCFVPMLVAMMFPPRSILVGRIDNLLMRAAQAGFIDKLVSDVAWDQQRSGSGQLLQVSGGGQLKTRTVEERQLTLDDTQGMFLLLGAGFTMAVAALVAECCVSMRNNTKKHTTPHIWHLPSIVYSDVDNCSGHSHESAECLDGLEVSAQVHMVETPQSMSLTTIPTGHFTTYKRLSI